MAKVERPLWSDEATGRVGQAISFKKGAVWNSITPQFHRNQAYSISLRTQRDKFRAACASWRLFSETEKQYYTDNAPSNLTGFQYYLQCVL